MQTMSYMRYIMLRLYSDECTYWWSFWKSSSSTPQMSAMALWSCCEQRGKNLNSITRSWIWFWIRNLSAWSNWMGSFTSFRKWFS